MISKFLAITGLILATAAPALAQEQSTLQPVSDEDAKVLIGAPLDTSATGGTIDVSDETLFFIGGSNVKPSGEWSQADSTACSTAGGIELPISAGRIACIRL